MPFTYLVDMFCIIYYFMLIVNAINLLNSSIKKIFNS